MSSESSQSTPDIDVAYVANLARMHLTEDEIARFESQLAQVVGYVRQIQSVDTSDVEPTAHAIEISNVQRDDSRREGITSDQAMRNAPVEKDGFFVVPKIVE